MIYQDSPISPASSPIFSTTSECPPNLAEAPARGQDLQIVPSIAMGQLWEPLVGVPPTPVNSASPQVGDSALCGMESAPDFSRFGGREPSFVARSESFDDALCTDLLMSHDGEEGRLAVKPLNVLFPCVVNDSELLDWVVKCAEQIHSKVGITYVGQKWQFMALLTFLEIEQFKELEDQTLSTSKRNKEVKNLECSINYDNRGERQSSRGKRKGAE